MLVCDTVVTGSLFMVLDAIRVGRNSQAQVFGSRFFVHFIRERENPAFGCLV